MSKKFLIGLLIGEFLVALVIGGSCWLRKDEQIAIRDWMDHPNATTKAELDRQRAITRRYNLAFTGILFLTMVVPTGFIYQRKAGHRPVDLPA